MSDDKTRRIRQLEDENSRLKKEIEDSNAENRDLLLLLRAILHQSGGKLKVAESNIVACENTLVTTPDIFGNILIEVTK